MRRIYGVIIASLVMVGSLFLTQPAQAADTTACNHFQPDALSDLVTFCMTLRSRVQNDGTGVTAEHLWTDINNNCDELEDNLKFYDAQISVTRINGGPTVLKRIPLRNSTVCHDQFDLELPGYNTGGSQFNVTVTPAEKFSLDDSRLTIRFAIHSNV